MTTDVNGHENHTAQHDEHEGEKPNRAKQEEKRQAEERRRQLSVNLVETLTATQQLPPSDRTDLLGTIEELAAKVTPINRAAAQKALTALLELGDDDARLIARAAMKLTGIPTARRTRVLELLKRVLELHGGNSDHDEVLVASVKYARQVFGGGKARR
jgi:truncated hemoglobin YjbI